MPISMTWRIFGKRMNQHGHIKCCKWVPWQHLDGSWFALYFHRQRNIKFSFRRHILYYILILIAYLVPSARMPISMTWRIFGTNLLGKYLLQLTSGNVLPWDPFRLYCFLNNQHGHIKCCKWISWQHLDGSWYSPFIFIDKETLNFRSEGISYIIKLIF
jgi:hypothetical protein